MAKEREKIYGMTIKKILTFCESTPIIRKTNILCLRAGRGAGTERLDYILQSNTEREREESPRAVRPRCTRTVHVFIVHCTKNF